MHRILRVTLLLLMGHGLVSAAAEPARELLLMGFEPAEVKTWTAALAATSEDAKAADGTPHVLFKVPSILREWRFFKGKASQGEQAMGLSLISTDVEPCFNFKVPPEPKSYYGLFQRGLLGSLNTSGAFRRILPMDWSAYGRLRLDLFAEEVAQTIRIQLEDEEIAPPIVRNIVVPPGRWTCLEIDLREAEKIRRLDLKRMASLVVAVVKLESPTKKSPSAWLDHIRLAPAAGTANLPVLRDQNPLDLPEYYKASSKPVPEKLPAGTPDRKPLPAQTPSVIPLDKPLAVTPAGWAAAYDNQHLLLGFCDGTNAFTLQSADGGKTWKGLDGTEKPTPILTRIGAHCIDHQAGRGDVVGQRADLVLMSNMGCVGQSLSSLRWFSQKLTFTGSGWALEKVPALVDCDMRHCTSNHSVVRTPNGRLWAAYGLVGRLGTIQINVKYSDDDAVTWKSVREGTSGVIPGSIGSEQAGVGFGTYNFEEPCLVPLGDGVACIWEEIKGKKLKWARFDGVHWSAIEEIPAPPRVSLIWCRPQLHAISIGAKEIYAVSGFRKGVLHYRDGKWEQILPEVPFSARLSLAGRQTVVVVAVKSLTDNPRLGPMVIQAWQRQASGLWSEPRELAREEHPLTSMEALNELRPGLVVQAYAPPNFVPLAWSCKGQNWIKYLRLPVEEKK